MSFKSKSIIGDNLYELNLCNMKIVEKYPIHVGLTVLHLSKLIMLRFIVFLYEHLKKDSFKIIYTDTDSLSVCLTDNLDNLVKFEMKESWITLKSKWFVVDPNDPWDIRYPGKMKVEWETTTGSMIALCPKTYFAFDTETEEFKRSSKGIQHSVKLRYKDYYNVLYEDEEKYVPNNLIKLHGSQMCTFIGQKRGLQGEFIKAFVEKDRVSIKPFSVNL